jgi:hypothetical protein
VESTLLMRILTVVRAAVLVIIGVLGFGETDLFLDGFVRLVG